MRARWLRIWKDSASASCSGGTANLRAEADLKLSSTMQLAGAEPAPW